MTCKVDTGRCPDKLPEGREMRQTEARQLNRLRDLLSQEYREEAWTAGEWTWRDASPTEPRGWRRLWQRPVAHSKRRLRNMEVNCSNFKSVHLRKEDKAANLRASSWSCCRGQLVGWTERTNCSASLCDLELNKPSSQVDEVDQSFLEIFPIILLPQTSVTSSIWLSL